MKKKILELIAKHTGDCDSHGDSFEVVYDDEFEELADDINELFFNKWVPISERKPDDVLGCYMVCLENNAVFEMNYSSLNEKWWLSSGSYENENNPVVYWMEKPEPPSQE